MSHPTFDQLTLERVRRREPAAMNAFFEAFIGPVYAYLFAVVREPMLAEDLSQTAFLKLHRGLDRLDPRRDPAPWVFTIVANTLRDHWRSRAHRDGGRNVPLEDLRDPIATSPPRTVEDEVSRNEEDTVLHAAMQNLSAADREILWLREFEDRSVSEAGTILGIRPDAVRQRHSRAVRRLGELYRELGSVPEGNRP